MDWDLIQWATMIVGPAVGWLAARITRRVDSQKQLLETIERQGNSIAELYERQGYTDRILAARNSCRYIALCPIDAELWRLKAINRQPQPHNRQRNGPDSYNIENPDGTPDAGRPPPEPP